MQSKVLKDFSEQLAMPVTGIGGSPPSSKTSNLDLLVQQETNLAKNVHKPEQIHVQWFQIFESKNILASATDDG